jgi:hypothetical protein
MTPTEPEPVPAPPRCAETGKAIFTSRTAAIRAARGAKSRRTRVRQRPYFRPQCRHWHLASVTHSDGQRDRIRGGPRPGQPMSVEDAFAELERRNAERTA